MAKVNNGKKIGPVVFELIRFPQQQLYGSSAVGLASKVLLQIILLSQRNGWKL